MVVNKRMQKEAPKKYQEKVFDEFKELEEQKKLWNSCKRSRRKGKSENVAKIGRIQSDTTLE